MNVFTFIAVYAGLAVLLLAALSPVIVELDARFPAGRRQRAAAASPATPAAPRPAKALKGTRITAHA
ncbi:hypothetical protein ABZU76_01780 [Amycolatopsis sp. NPDC005232]|uniref:hypothetical protein n=1 Tax=unclassified Amycolatopsis TaxID=2618356 RepID=UPI001C69E809|nr:hypothetical protein [Amycolatopsis sp. DSM 110486]QYN23047.1 hypothetical protein K1T34_11595 [Amycolatopsis sp. DSM 110486]